MTLPYKPFSVMVPAPMPTQGVPYAAANPDAIAGLLLESEQGDPDELGTPSAFPTVVPEKPEDKVTDMQQLAALAQLHIEELKSYTQASEMSQWKASDPATR